MQLPEKFESERLLRKSVHLLGFSVPFLVMKIGMNPVILMIAICTILYLVSEGCRLRGRSFPLLTEFTVRTARPEELSSYVLAPVCFALGIVISLLVFAQPVAFAAIASLTLGDGASSILGGLGHRRLPFNPRKTWEGTISGFLLGCLGALVFVSPPAALLGGAVGAFMEALPLAIDDNLTVPTSSGIAISALLLL